MYLALVVVLLDYYFF